MKKNAKTEDAILALLKARGSMSAVDLAGKLNITAIGMRQHLKRMNEMGMIAATPLIASKPKGAGRPATSWELTTLSHNKFGDSHALLTKDLIESARAVFGDEGVEQLVAHREDQTLKLYQEAMSAASPLKVKVAQLVRLREQEGYMAEVEEDGQGGFLFVENHCPICTAATVCQGFCRAELSIFRTVLGPDAIVERVEYLLEGGRRCSYTIRPKSLN
ncbi:helix-turn-helix transcriptional regulator [Kiloniella antarctica]|uniref:Helix-turn-helix transcriptional regulator n=1 Tax=Kiloniella antarctica TaxID=1550907 RepID=A0ABW5BFG8_9PROT